MYYERCGIQVKKIVTLVAVEDGQVQVFEEYDLEKYYNLLLEYIDEYMESIKWKILRKNLWHKRNSLLW